VNVRNANAARIKAIDCNFQGRINNAYATLLMNTGAGADSRFDLEGCLIRTPPTFSNGVLVQHSAGAMSFTDCEVVLAGGGFSAGFGNRLGYWSVLGSTSCTLERTTFNTEQGGQAAIMLRGAPECHTQIRNCSFVDSVVPGPVGGSPNIVQTEAGVGNLDLRIQHSTFASIDLTSPTTRAVQVTTDGTGAQTVTLDNNIFYLPTSNVGAVRFSSVDPPAFPITINAGTNLRYTGAGTALVEQLTGTILTQDPLLLADSIHIQTFSPAAGAGVDLGFAVDIDGEARPNPVGNGPDLGADEVEDTEAPLGATNWLAYQ